MAQRQAHRRLQGMPWRLLLLAAWLLAAAAAAGPAQRQQQQQTCPVDDAALSPSACGRACRQETEAALRAIYDTWNGPDWRFEGAMSGVAASDGNWTACLGAACTGAVAVAANNSSGHGREPMPSYCCWTGVFCCHERSPFSHSEEFMPRCAPYSVRLLQLRSANIHGNLGSIMGPLEVLHQHGMVQLDVSRNWLTGSIPQGLGALSNLSVLVLGSNSEWMLGG